MIAAPLSTVDINVDLPASTAQPAPRPEKPLFVMVKSDLSLVLGEAAVSRDTLAGALDRGRQGAAHLRSRRPHGRLWRDYGTHESPARRWLFEARARRLGSGPRRRLHNPGRTSALS